MPKGHRQPQNLIPHPVSGFGQRVRADMCSTDLSLLRTFQIIFKQTSLSVCAVCISCNALRDKKKQRGPTTAVAGKDINGKSLVAVRDFG